MGRLSRFRHASCKRKIAHRSLEDAHAALDASRGNRIERMAPYQCEFCGSWHNGHQRVDDVRFAEPLPNEEPRCGCGHGADAHEDWWIPRGRCAFCKCMRTRQEIYRVEIRELRRKHRVLGRLMKAACRFYFPAMRQALSEHLSRIAKAGCTK